MVSARKRTVSILLVLVAMVCTVTILYAMRSESKFSILNPFRNRDPEDRAETFLRLLGDGQCMRAMTTLPATPERLQQLCEREEKFSLTSWRLIDRTDEPQQVTLLYRVRRDSYGGRVSVAVERRGEHWQVTRYEPLE